MKAIFSFFATLLFVFSIISCHKSGSSDSGLPGTQDTLMAWQKIKKLGSADDIWFVSSTKGFVCGMDSLYRSLDGGNTWAAAPGNPTGVYNLQFFDSQAGAAIGRTSLYTTSNGGDAWVKRTLPDLYVSNGAIVYNDIQMTSPSTAYANGNNGIFKSDDTCKTWTKLNADPVNIIFFFNNTEGFYTRVPGSSGVNNFLHTTDGGTTWTGLSQLTNVTSPASFLQFTDATHGWTCNSSNFCATADGGKTWTTAAFNYPLTDGFFINNQTGFLTNGGEIYKTTDGGKNWTRVCKLANSGIIEIYFLNENTGWAVCGDGSILILK